MFDNSLLLFVDEINNLEKEFQWCASKTIYKFVLYYVQLNVSVSVSVSRFIFNIESWVLFFTLYNDKVLGRKL